VVNPLTVQLDPSAYIYLDCGTEPSASPEAIQRGQRVNAKGTISGGPASAVVDSGELRIKPGRATVIDPIGNFEDGAFVVETSSISEAEGFGDSVDEEAELYFFPETVYEGDVSSLEEFETVFGGSASIELRIQGIAAIGQNAIEVYEVDVRVD